MSAPDAGALLDAGGSTVVDGAVPSPAVDTSLARGLLLYLPFDDAAGTHDVSDRSGLVQSVRLRDRDPNTAWVRGRVGGALDLHGTGSSCGFLEVQNPRGFDTLPALSIAVWVETTSARATGAILARASQSGTTTTLGVLDGHLAGYLDAKDGASPNALSGSMLPAQGWSHVALTYDGAGVHLYLDGREVVAANRTGALAAGVTALLIGTQHVAGDSGGADFCGALDELVVYDRALAANEVARLAAGQRPVPAN